MIVIVDFGMGNLRSVEKALLRLGAEAKISSDPAVIRSAHRLILPGVGNFSKGMEQLNARGLPPLLGERVLAAGVPILGICLGMQLFAGGSEEGDAEGLGWLDAEVVKFHFPGGRGKFRVPHMGWNHLETSRTAPLLNGITPGDSFYFVHSYHVVCRRPADILAFTDYGIRFVSALQKDNIVGVQFHPEKSHSSGLRLLRNFVEQKG